MTSSLLMTLGSASNTRNNGHVCKHNMEPNDKQVGYFILCKECRQLVEGGLMNPKTMELTCFPCDNELYQKKLDEREEKRNYGKA